jgi:hypothetical protein
MAPKKAAKAASPKGPTPPGYIFRASITLRTGEVIYAKDYGLKAFKIRVGANDNFVPPHRGAG